MFLLFWDPMVNSLLIYEFLEKLSDSKFLLNFVQKEFSLSFLFSPVGEIKRLPSFKNKALKFEFLNKYAVLQVVILIWELYWRYFDGTDSLIERAYWISHNKVGPTFIWTLYWHGDYFKLQWPKQTKTRFFPFAWKVRSFLCLWWLSDWKVSSTVPI